MIYDPSLDELRQKVWEGRRIDTAEAGRLYRLPLEELGALAAFLASEQASYITGQSIAVDGGWIKGLM